MGGSHLVSLASLEITGAPLDSFGLTWSRFEPRGLIWTQFINPKFWIRLTRSHLVSHELAWSHLVSLGLTWPHLLSRGLTWFHLASIGLTWTHLDLFHFISFHLDSLELTWFHLDSIGFTWIHLVLLITQQSKREDTSLAKKGKGESTGPCYFTCFHPTHRAYTRMDETTQFPCSGGLPKGGLTHPNLRRP